MIVEGQTLCCQPIGNRKGPPYPVTVQKVGRKWATVFRGGAELCRIDKETLAVDSGNFSPLYRMWLSREEFDQSVTRQNCWADLQRRIARYAVPDDITIDQIKAATATLFPPT
ncbi:MAG: hypothetical protein ACRYHQ_32560 [Janthinobacterium lividum]